jgi:hypothetical protein
VDKQAEGAAVMDARIEKPEVAAEVKGMPSTTPAYENLQVRRPDTIFFTTVEGLQSQSGVAKQKLRRLCLKELVDNALDASAKAGRCSAEIEQLAPHQFRITDYGDGIPGSPKDLAELFTLDRMMASGKFWRLPERGAMGNGLRFVVGCVVVCRGTIEVVTRGRCTVLRPQKACPTEIVETYELDGAALGTAITVTLSEAIPSFIGDLVWARNAIAISENAKSAYEGRPSPHWLDTEKLHEVLGYMCPAETTVRQYIEGLDGCSGGKAGKIAAPFGKNRTCRSMTEADAAALLTALQAATRPVKRQVLGEVGRDAQPLDGTTCYNRVYGSFRHGSVAPLAEIPFIVEVWAEVRTRKGSESRIAVVANRTPIVVNNEISITRDGLWHGNDSSRQAPPLVIDGAGMHRAIEVKGGDCGIAVHITSPLIPTLSMGKQPNLSVFGDEIVEAIRLAFNRSRDMLPPDETEPKPPKPAKPEKPPKISLPPGPLRQKIEAEAKRTGLLVDDLTVLSAKSDPYTLDNDAAHRMGRWFKEQYDRARPDGRPIHLRGMHYVISLAAETILRPDGKPYLNTNANWHWLGQVAAKCARWLGYVPFNSIIDRRNDAPILRIAKVLSDIEPQHSVLSGEMIRIPSPTKLLPYLSVEGGKAHRQPYLIVFIGEKSSLDEELLPIIEAVGGVMYLSTGETSDTHLSDIAQLAAKDGRPMVVFYFHDFDPDGWQMPISVSRKLQAFNDLMGMNINMKVYDVSLTIDQVKQYNLASKPLKKLKKDHYGRPILNKRAQRWLDVWKHEQTEIDALIFGHPGVLRQIAFDAVRPFWDPTLEDRAAALWDDWRERAAEWFERQTTYVDCKAEIAEAHATILEAKAVIDAAQGRALEKLTDAVETAGDMPPLPVDDIEPILVGEAPEPMFTTDDDYAVASIKLLQRKRLIFPDDDDSGSDDDDDE